VSEGALAAVVIGALFVCLHLGALYLIKRMFRWAANWIDRFSGIDTSRF
jgi:hypothetical protein